MLVGGEVAILKNIEEGCGLIIEEMPIQVKCTSSCHLNLKFFALLKCFSNGIFGFPDIWAALSEVLYLLSIWKVEQRKVFILLILIKTKEEEKERIYSANLKNQVCQLLQGIQLTNISRSYYISFRSFEHGNTWACNHFTISKNANENMCS